MEELEELKGRMLTQRPDSWSRLPDLELYMDQLISYMPRQLIHYEGWDTLTSAMVNNYIKDGLLPRAQGKRYNRDHLAYLTAICAMKPVISMKEMGTLFGAMEGRKGSEENWYGAFLEELDRCLTRVGEGLPTDLGREELADLACSLALNSYANKLACQRVLALLREDGSDQAEPKKKKGKEPLS